MRGGRTRCSGEELDVGGRAGISRRRGYDARLGPRPERAHPVTDEAVQRVGVGARRRRAETMRSGIVLDSHRPARCVVTVILMRRAGRNADGGE